MELHLNMFISLDDKIMHNKSFTPLNFVASHHKMGKRYSFTVFIFLLIALFFINVKAIVPGEPIVVSPNTESSPSNFIFSFVLEK